MSTVATTLTIRGMSCGHCVAAVRKHLEALDGVTVHEVEVGRATIEADPALVSPATLAAAIDDAGFALDPQPVFESSGPAER